MARLPLLEIAAACLLAALPASAQPSAGERILADRCVRAQLERLLYGAHQNVEVAAFLVDHEGELSVPVWPRLAWVGKQTWEGPPPPGTIAVVHTHPAQRPMPSYDDAKQAAKLRIPFFVITSRSIAVADPEPQLHVTVAAAGWNAVGEQCKAARQPRGTRPPLEARSTTPADIERLELPPVP